MVLSEIHSISCCVPFFYLIKNKFNTEKGCLSKVTICKLTKSISLNKEPENVYILNFIFVIKCR